MNWTITSPTDRYRWIEGDWIEVRRGYRMFQFLVEHGVALEVRANRAYAMSFVRTLLDLATTPIDNPPTGS